MPARLLALVGVCAQAVGWALYFVLRETPLYAWLLLAAGGVLVALAVVVDFKRMKTVATSRPGQFGVSMAVGAALAFAIVLVLNTISYGHYLRFDLTWLRQFTLTTQTKEALARLDSPVEVAVVFAPGAAGAVGDHAANLLAEYQNYSDMVTVRRIDPDISPDQVRRYGIDRTGAALGVVVFSGAAGRRQVLAPTVATEAEHAFTEALLEASGVAQKTVYVLVGYDGPRLGGDFSLAADALRDNLFRVAELDLAAGAGIPGDAAAIVLAGPRRSPSLGEFDALRDYLAAGGGLFVLIDPDPAEGVKRFLADWWMTVEVGSLVDPSSHVVPNVDVPLVDRSRNSFGLAQTYFPGATAILPSSDLPADVDMAALAWTSPSSWLDRDIGNPENPVFDADADLRGPLAIGSLVSIGASDRTATAQIGRLAVIGDSDFATNRHIQSGNNADLFVSVIGWLSADERLVSVERKALNIRRLILSPQEARFLNLSSIGLLPLILFAAGGYRWWRRR